MKSITRNVRDMSAADREAFEHVIGERLCEDQRILIEVVDAGASMQRATAEPPRETGAVPDVPDWWKIYEGLSDEEIDQLDEAIRQRADLTRTFE
ncbi:MAG: hypothetical protein WD069_10265 [Planctomycetales bacterium]